METHSVPPTQPIEKGVLLPPIQRHRAISRPPQIPSSRPAAGKDLLLVQERQRLLIEMFPLVKRMAFKIREHLPAQVEVDDLIANGMLGLVDAISKFDSTKSVKLESYARHRVRGSILDGLRSVDPASRDLRKKNKKIQKLYREMEVKLGHTITDEEIAKALGMSLDQWHDTLNEIQALGFDFGARSISAGPTSKRVTTEPELLARDDEDPFDLCYQREKREIMARALLRLREREREIISLYYQQEFTMKQIADRMKIDESRVSQLHSAAIARLRASVNSLLCQSPDEKATKPRKLSMMVGAGG